MKNRIWNTASLFSLSLAGIMMTVGCNSSSDSPKQVSNKSTTTVTTDSPESIEATDTEHGHVPGAHGGIMVSLGRDSYHVEAVVDADGSIRLYTLGQDETRVIDVEVQTLKGFLKGEGDVDSRSINFEPSPQEGDGDKKTSLFIGKLPVELVGRKLDVTVPNIRIDGERFRLGFQTGQERHHETAGMPEKVSDEAERTLYLTPGGRYTTADIAANGNMTASQKFKGFMSAHDMNPKAGDLICPITMTKANPKCAWVVGGKSYQFCCPPCIDEFVKNAKATNEAIPGPETYTKK